MALPFEIGGVIDCAIVRVVFIEEDDKIDISVLFCLIEFSCRGLFCIVLH